jgi:hypothetical protein
VAKTRRVGSHLFRGVSREDLREVATLATPEQRTLFSAMHRADQRHGLDVLRSLRTWGVDDPDLLLAGLLHDAGKGSTGLVPRVVYSLGHAYGAWILRLARRLPWIAGPLDRLERHPEVSARLAAQAGCGPRVVELIRQHVTPGDDPAAQLLRRADEAN